MKRYYDLWTISFRIPFFLNTLILNWFLRRCSFLLSKMLIDGLEFIVMFLSAALSVLSDSHSDSTHALPRIHGWARNVMLRFTKSVWWSNSSSSWMASGWVHFSKFSFWVNYSFTKNWLLWIIYCQKMHWLGFNSCIYTWILGYHIKFLMQAAHKISKISLKRVHTWGKAMFNSLRWGA